MSKPFYRPREYAELWGVHINTVYFWIRNQLLPGVRSVKCCKKRLHYIPIGVIPPRLYPGPCPQRRRVMPPDDMPPWDPKTDLTYHPGKLPEGVSMEEYLKANQISMDQISDEEWEVKASQCQAIETDSEVS